MKIQDVILRAMAKKITWLQAAEIIGITDRQKRRCEKYGYDGLLDRRRGALHSGETYSIDFGLYVEYHWGKADAIKYLNGLKPKI